jgi:hypothetical protein
MFKIERDKLCFRSDGFTQKCTLLGTEEFLVDASPASRSSASAPIIHSMCLRAYYVNRFKAVSN